jgi:hypothetical protein
MAIEVISNEGLAVSLNEYQELKATQAGHYFYDSPQELLRESLGEFLPEAKRISSDRVLFSVYRTGKEILSSSKPMPQGQMPRKSLDRLEGALQKLQMRIDDPATPEDKRQILKAFKLPDPLKEPDLYRLGRGTASDSVFILWGCEKSSSNSGFPAEVLKRVTPYTGQEQKRALLTAAACLALLLLLLLFLLWPGKKDEKAYALIAPTTGPSDAQPRQSVQSSAQDDPSPIQNGDLSTKAGNSDPIPSGTNIPASPESPNPNQPPAVLEKEPTDAQNPLADQTKSEATTPDGESLATAGGPKAKDDAPGAAPVSVPAVANTAFPPNEQNSRRQDSERSDPSRETSLPSGATAQRQRGLSNAQPRDTRGRTDPYEHGAEKLSRGTSAFSIAKEQNGRLLDDGTVEVPLTVRNSNGPLKPKVLEWHVNNTVLPGSEVLRTQLPIGPHTISAKIEGSRFSIRATILVEKESKTSEHGDFTVLPN